MVASLRIFILTFLPSPIGHACLKFDIIFVDVWGELMRNRRLIILQTKKIQFIPFISIYSKTDVTF